MMLWLPAAHFVVGNAMMLWLPAAHFVVETSFLKQSVTDSESVGVWIFPGRVPASEGLSVNATSTMQRRQPLRRVASLSEPPSAIRAVAGAGSESEEPGVEPGVQARRARVTGSPLDTATALAVGLVGPGPEDLPALHVARGWAVGGCTPASGQLVGGG
jgi:hypothetical protein